MAKLIGFIIIFIIFMAFKLVVMGSKKAIEIGKDAYEAANNNEPFLDSFNKMREKNKVSLPEAIIAMMTKIAKSDGHISQTEADVIMATIDDFVNIIKTRYPSYDTTNYRSMLVKMSKDAKDNYKDISFYASVIKNDTIEIKETVIAQLVVLASVDGYTSVQEKMIYSVSDTISFSSYRLQQIIDQFISSPEADESTYQNPYEILGCTIHDSIETIKRKYRELVKKFHPDIVQGKDLGDEFVEFAANKMKEINFAFETIKKEKGFN